MEGLDRALIAIMIVVIVIVGVILLVPRTRGVAYRVGSGLSAAVYESNAYVPATAGYVQNPYYTQPWYYSNTPSRTTSSVTTYSTSQPQYYTYTTTTPTTTSYTYSPDTVMCGINLPCSVYWNQYPQNNYQYYNY